jgi:hypothetical protein
MLWGIAIADTRVAGYETARVEIARAQLTCRVDGKDVTLNDDHGQVRGGFYRRFPWFGTDAHDPLPLEHTGGYCRAAGWDTSRSGVAFLGRVAAS